MINIPCRMTPPLDKASLSTLNNKKGQPLNKDTLCSLNQQKREVSVGNELLNADRQMGFTSEAQKRQQMPPQNPHVSGNTSVQRMPDMPLPLFQHPLRKGQKTSLNSQGQIASKLKVCFGWNIIDARCDMDASAFMISKNGKVPDDSWFVFYSQTDSPDGSVKFSHDTSGKDREVITVDLGKMNDAIQKVVFVLTINEAFENKLNFSMIKDAYIRLIDGNTSLEIVSYRLEEYYPNVTSMTIGELYLHNGQWKFNPVGNGVNQDLAGQCAIYGVEIS